MLRIPTLLLAAATFAAVQDASHHDQRGVQLAQAGNLAAAIEQFQIALHLDPNYADAWYHLGLAIISRKTDEAMAGFEEALRLRPDHIEVDTCLPIAAGSAATLPANSIDWPKL